MEKKLRVRADRREDRISSLPVDVIHVILSFLSTRIAVQTSTLSKRWKLIWTTLPFLSFDERFFPDNVVIHHVFSRRNHDSSILKLEIRDTINQSNIPYWVKYAISHNVQELCIRTSYEYNLYIFSSISLKKLSLVKDDHGSNGPGYLLGYGAGYMNYFSDCWDLPALTSLRLDGINLPDSLSLPALATLHLVRCRLPQTVWEFPALLSLKLEHVEIPYNITDFFSALVSLKNLSVFFGSVHSQDCVIICPQLVYLEIKEELTDAHPYPNLGSVVILAPKLCTLNIEGIFSIVCGVSKLENVSIKLHGCVGNKAHVSWEMLKQHYRRLTFMFQELRGAKILTLDLDTIEALSVIYDLLQHVSSPFNNLKYVKLPQGCKESSISGTTKSYLLGGSPGATMVTSLPKDNVIAQIASVPVIAQNVALQEPLAPTMKLVDSQGIHDKLSADTLETRVQEELKVENSGLVAEKVRQVGPPVQGLVGLGPNAPGAGNDLASISRGNKTFGLWQGHEVKSEFIGLLDLIMKKYPETFEHFTFKSKKLCTMKLNMLCTSVNEFSSTAMTEIDTEMITEYRKLFADLQTSFNINWLVSRLNDIEQIQAQEEFHAIDSCIDNAESNLQVSSTLAAQMKKMHEALGTIGDCLFSGP